LALFQAAGFLGGDLVTRQGIAIPMVDMRARFMIPSAFGDEITVETTITRFGRSSFDVLQRVMKGTDLAVECSETRVWIRVEATASQRLKSQPIPEAVIRALSQDAV
jgi:4-hydroxybenzoyl-CoA thioesterase